MSETKEVVHTVKHGDVVVDIAKTVNPQTGNVFFDYRTCKVYYTPDGDEVRTAFCGRFDINNHVKALMDTMEWIRVWYKNYYSKNV